MAHHMEASPRQAYRTRIDVLFAARAPRAVVLRRGPRTHHHLLAWDLDTDTFTAGQWMKGLVRLCDLAPSGDRLIYWAAQYNPRAHWRTARQTTAGDYEPLASRGSFVERARKRRPSRKLPRYLRGPGADSARPRENQGCWTAICKPPWFTALAIWPSYGHWTGGGIFRTDNEIVLLETDDGMTPVSAIRMPSRFRVLSPKQARLAPVSPARRIIPDCRLQRGRRRSLPPCSVRARVGWSGCILPKPTIFCTPTTDASIVSGAGMARSKTTSLRGRSG